MKRYSTKLFTFATFHTIIFLLLVSCSSDSSSQEPLSGTVLHPIEELIPFYDRNHIKIERSGVKNDLDFTNNKILSKLHHYLNDSTQFELKNIRFVLNDVSSMQTDGFGVDKLSFLDTSEDRLFIYDVQSGNVDTLAEFGPGPGELQHSTDLKVINDHVYVSRRDMRLSRFNCAAGDCVYDTTLEVESQPLSITGDSEKMAMAVNVKIDEGEEMEKDSFINFSPIQLINTENGDLIESFGEIYNTGFMMVLERFARTGLIESIPENNKYVWANSWFPFLYVYDENLELEDTYEIVNHTQNKFEFTPSEQRRSFTERDHTIISEVQILDGGLILLITATQTNQRENNEGQTIYDFSNNYYVIDHSNRKASYLGSEEYVSGYKKLVLPVEDVLIKNDGGELFKVAEV